MKHRVLTALVAGMILSTSICVISRAERPISNDMLVPTVKSSAKVETSKNVVFEACDEDDNYQCCFCTTYADEPAEDEFVKYTVNGEYLPLSEFLWNCLKDEGIATEYIYKIALCQCYQESRFDVHAVSYDGKDYGLFQFRKIYWDEYSAAAGWSGYDVTDPYVQCRVYAHHLRDRLAGGDTFQAISDHYTGKVGYNAQYVSDVLQWMATIEEVTDGTTQP